jgi:hypothetical protein
MTIHALPQVAALLLPDNASVVIRVFRKLDLFRRDYQSSHLQELVNALAGTLQLEAADAIVSESLMLDNELRLRATGTIAFFPADAPTASHDEAALLNLIAGMQHGDYRRAAHAAVQLEILQSRMLLILAHKLGRRLAEAGIRLDGVYTGAVPPAGSMVPGPRHHGRARLRLVQREAV